MDCGEFCGLIDLAVRDQLRWHWKRRFYEHRDECDSCMREWQIADSILEEQRRAHSPSDADVGTDTPIICIVEVILQQAIVQGADEVRIEPSDRRAILAYRVKGELSEGKSLPDFIKIPLLVRLKSMAGVDYTQFDADQEGTIRYRHKDEDYQYAAEFTPMGQDERIVLRLVRASQCHPRNADLNG